MRGAGKLASGEVLMIAIGEKSLLPAGTMSEFAQNGMKARFWNKIKSSEPADNYIEGSDRVL
jgi:hypothetical protein